MFHMKLNHELTFNEFIDVMNKIKEIKQHETDIRAKSFDRQTAKVAKKKITITYTVSPTILKRLFAKYDTNNDGVVDLQELKYALKNIITNETIEELFNEHDTDKNHVLDLNEFLKIFAIEKSTMV